jgi:hypothetical protein
MFATPEPDLKSVYFSSLLVELCKISPGTVAPAMGKCVRRLYVGLGATVDDPTAPVRLDAEGVRRFAEWFSTHLSNFNFSWRWPEWCVIYLTVNARSDQRVGNLISRYLRPTPSESSLIDSLSWRFDWPTLNASRSPCLNLFKNCPSCSTIRPTTFRLMLKVRLR